MTTPTDDTPSMAEATVAPATTTAKEPLDSNMGDSQSSLQKTQFALPGVSEESTDFAHGDIEDAIAKNTARGNPHYEQNKRSRPTATLNHGDQSSTTSSHKKKTSTTSGAASTVSKTRMSSAGSSQQEQPTPLAGNGSTATGKPSEQTSTEPMIVYKTPLYMHVVVCLALAFGLAGIVLAAVALKHANDNDVAIRANAATDVNGDDVACVTMEGDVCLDATATGFDSLLDAVYDRGYLNCGLSFEQAGFLSPTGVNRSTGGPLYEGLDVDLCRILAAAIFDGDAEAYVGYTFPPTERWNRINSTQIDVLFRPTRTMERDIHIAEIGTGLEFSKPYFYDGLSFGGLGDFVECAETGTVNGTCADLKVCVLGGGTHDAVVGELVPLENIVFHFSETDYYQAFPNECNVIAGERAWITQAALRQRGYEGPYTLGTGVYSREPLCLVSRRGDPTWTGFIQAILNALIFAEEEGITQSTAHTMPTTDIFGPRLERMYQRAVAVRGNYGELYQHHLEAFLPRVGLNLLNRGNAARIWSFPYGNLAAPGPNLEDASPTVKRIMERGFLRCGHSIVRGLSEFDSTERRYSGMSIDLCKAVSAALFDGIDQSVLRSLPFTERFPAVDGEAVDMSLLFSPAIPDDVNSGNTGRGLDFTSPYYFIAIGFGGVPLYVDCADRLDIISPECQALLLCIPAATNLVDTFSELLHESYLVEQPTLSAIYDAFLRGECNVIFSGELQIQESVLRSLGYPSDLPYVVGTQRFDIVPAAVATSDADPVWSAFVDWILMSLVYAEEQGINQASANLMPRTSNFGIFHQDAFYHAVNIVGNYGEIYQRNLGDSLLPRRGMHLLNDNSSPRQFSLVPIRS